MGFWIRNIIFGVLLVGLAVFFFANQELLMSLDEVTPEPTAPAVVKTDKVTPPPPKVEKETPKNKAAKGLSDFYANISADLGENGPTIRNNIVYLPDPNDDLETLLDNRKKVVRAYPKNWVGSTESRPFRLGETLFQKLSEYAEKDQLVIFWRLNRDYIVKDAFRINKNILKTALQVGQGIEGHFQNGVSVYFCYQSRAIVVIEGVKSYLDEQCKLIKPNTNY